MDLEATNNLAQEIVQFKGVPGQVLKLFRKHGTKRLNRSRQIDAFVLCSLEFAPKPREISQLARQNRRAAVDHRRLVSARIGVQDFNASGDSRSFIRRHSRHITSNYAHRNSPGEHSKKVGRALPPSSGA
jgi:hypothetical protein